jgi:subtilisin family serine protease
MTRPASIRRLAVAMVLLLACASISMAQVNNPGGGRGGGGGGGGGRDDDGSGAVSRADAVHSSGRPEFILVTPPGVAQTAVDTLVAAGAQPLRQRTYPALGRQAVIFLLPRGLDREEAQDLLDPAAPGAVIDFHHLYRFAQGTPRLYAPQLVGDPGPGRCGAPGSVTVGIIDGPVDAAHPALSGANVIIEGVLGEGRSQPNASHGTAVAALIVGRDGSGALAGFASGARLHAVAAFRRDGGADVSDVEHVGAALDRLMGRGVRLINMSFAGSQNRAFADLLSVAAGRGAVMVAAAGNNGSSRAAYPAGHPGVIAVTAVDARLRLYRSANTGAHIEFAAPGVDLFVAGGGGGRYESGTSYAAPIVSALVARMGNVSVSAARQRLSNTARDLGDPGRDTRFGWGLVQAPTC